MAVSRPFVLALLGVVLLAAAFFAVQNARTASSEDPAPAEAPAPRLTPKQQLDAAFGNDDLESARFEGELSFRFRHECGSVNPGARRRLSHDR